MRFQLMGSSDPGLPVCERTFRKWQAPSLRRVYLGHFSVNCIVYCSSLFTRNVKLDK